MPARSNASTRRSSPPCPACCASIPASRSAMSWPPAQSDARHNDERAGGCLDEHFNFIFGQVGGRRMTRSYGVLIQGIFQLRFELTHPKQQSDVSTTSHSPNKFFHNRTSRSPTPNQNT